MDQANESLVRSFANDLGCKVDRVSLIKDTKDISSNMVTCWRRSEGYPNAIGWNGGKKLLCPQLRLSPVSGQKTTTTFPKDKSSQDFALENLAFPIALQQSEEILSCGEMIGCNVMNTFLRLVKSNLRRYFIIKHADDNERATR